MLSLITAFVNKGFESLSAVVTAGIIVPSTPVQLAHQEKVGHKG